MKVLFLTLARIDSIEVQGIYQDLLRKFRDNGHDLIIVSPTERKFKNKTNYFTEGKVKILNVWTTNIQKTNIIEKGIHNCECLFSCVLLTTVLIFVNNTIENGCMQY